MSNGVPPFRDEFLLNSGELMRIAPHFLTTKYTDFGPFWPQNMGKRFHAIGCAGSRGVMDGETGVKDLARQNRKQFSGSTKPEPLSDQAAQPEKLAERVEKLGGEAFNMYDGSLKKLRELTPMIAQLRQQFMQLKPAGEKIAGCRTWT